MDAHEALEHAEHAAHASHGEGHAPSKTGTYIGLSMALLGVLLAFCSAMVGASRTELIKTMVERSDAHTKYQAQNTKHRLALTQLQTLHSNLVSQRDVERIDAQLEALAKSAGTEPTAAKDVPAVAVKADAKTEAKGDAAKDASVTSIVVRGLQIASKEIVQILAPEKNDAKRLVLLTRKYEKELDAGREWTESYDAVIEAHTEASEQYERAQLAAEIGIVVASIALLLGSRKIWSASLVLGALCIGLTGYTYASTHRHIEEGEHAIETKKHAYQELRKTQSQAKDDEQLLHDVETAFGGGE